MGTIDLTVMTKEAIALRNGEQVFIDGVHVRFTDTGRLDLEIPEGMKDNQLSEWLSRNANVIGYVPTMVEPRPEEPKPSVSARLGMEFEPLKPHEEK
jgi:hypothetical protein